MIFGNPLGFLALAGILAVLFIHLLQVRSRRVGVTTLFLLELRVFERDGGRKIERLRTSPLLWLQLLTVVAATWLLVEPRWLREDTTLRVVLVVDASASMSAYRDASEVALGRYLPELERSAERIEWIVLSSDPRAPTLYSGEERAAAAAAALGWRSYLGVHEMGASLSLASSLAGPRGLVVLLTDHAADVAPGVEVLAVGAPVDNVGFVSVSLEDDGTWRAIVKNSGSSVQRRSWWVEADGAVSAPMLLDIEPGQLRFLSGEMLQGVEQMELVLEGDRFALDDRLPFLLPRSKTFQVHVAPELEDNSFVRGFLETLEPFELAPASSADLALGRSGPNASILFAEPAPGYLGGPIVVENDDLVEGLDFRGLVVGNASDQVRAEDDRVLVWQGERPLLTLRETASTQTLLVGFALEESNADRIPAFVLALHRFAVHVRENKRAYFQDNVETRQLLDVALDVRERAPQEPGFFEIRSDGETLFRGAAHFADAREGDLSGARSREPDGGIVRDAVLLNSLPDPFASLWLLLLMGVAAYAWLLQEKRA